MKKMMIAAVLAATAAGASAQTYIGGAFGQGHVNVECGDATSCDKSDNGYKIYAGYKVNPAIAIEAAYVSFGEAKLTVPESGFLVDVGFESKGVLLAGAFRGALNPNFSVVGRLGLSFLKTKTSGSLLGFSESESNNSVKPYFGLGLEYALSKNVRATASADFTQATAEFDGVSDSGAVRLLSVGLQYDF